MKDIKVQLYEDNDTMRAMVGDFISNAPGFKLVGSYQNAQHAAVNCLADKPDAIIFDIDMPVVNGLDGVKMVRESGCETNIIMWTSYDSDGYLFEALRLGANGYLLKSTPPEEILASINEVIKGGAPMSPSIARKVLNSFNMKVNDVKLTPRERSILHELVEGNSYKMIAAKLDIRFDTVKAHIKKIYDKLHVHSQAEAVAKAIKDKLV